MNVGTKRWTVLIGLIAARIALGFHLQVLAVVGPGVSADLALTNTELGLLIGIFLAPGVVLALPGGALIQRFGEKSVIVLSLLVMTLGRWSPPTRPGSGRCCSPACSAASAES